MAGQLHGFRTHRRQSEILFATLTFVQKYNKVYTSELLISLLYSVLKSSW